MPGDYLPALFAMQVGPESPVQTTVKYADEEDAHDLLRICGRAQKHVRDARFTAEKRTKTMTPFISMRA
jgi:hypothetical protein